MRILIIGCGSIGLRHARNAKRFFNDVICFDKNQDTVKKVENQLSLSCFTSLKSALSLDIDAAIIATPTSTHIPIALEIIKHIPNILIEKPISNNSDLVHKLIDESNINNSNIFVACNSRFHPGVDTLYKNLKKIGKPLFLRAHVGNYLPNMRPDVDYRTLYCAKRSMGGGIILDSIHEIDYLMYFFGEMKVVSSFCEKISALEIDVEDYAEITFQHKNGSYSHVNMNYLRHFKRRGCEIVGDEGMLLWNSEGKSPEVCKVSFYEKSKNKEELIFFDGEYNPNKMYNELLVQFKKSIISKEDYNLLDLETAIRQLEIASKALEISRRN